MKMSIFRALRPTLLGLAGGLALAAGSHAAGPTPAPGGQNLAPSFQAPAITRRQTSIDSSGDDQRELQACRSGRTQQSRDACLEEVRNARSALRSGNLAPPGEDYMANALSRCEPFAGHDRAACEARVLGFGNTSGSVAGGGLLRWVETVVLPPGREEVTFVPKTKEPVVVIPMATK